MNICINEHHNEINVELIRCVFLYVWGRISEINLH